MCDDILINLLIIDQNIFTSFKNQNKLVFPTKNNIKD